MAWTYEEEYNDCGNIYYYVYDTEDIHNGYSVRDETAARKLSAVDDLIDAVNGLQMLLMRTFNDPTRLQEATAFLAADQALAKARGEK